MQGYILPKNFSLRAFRESARPFVLKKSRSSHCQRTLLDTFDGRIYRRGFILLQMGTDYGLFSLKTGGISKRCQCRTRKRIRFCQDLPPGPLHSYLSPVTPPRALLPRQRWLEKRHPFTVYNRQHQVLGHGELYEFETAAQVRFLFAAITPATGHKSELKAWQQRLLEDGATLANGSAFARFIEHAGLNLAGYSAKRVIRLQPHWPVQRALQRLLRFQLQVMLQNEAGLRGDWDVEFLHDFRVAIRRTRSLTSLFKKVLPSQRMQQARADFTFLSEKTNPLRDLDVQLLHSHAYHKLLPPSLHAGLEVLFKAVARERQKEFNAFIRVLDGVAFRRIKKNWLAFIRQEGQALAHPAEPGPDHALPVRDLVNRLVLRRFKKMQKMAAAITPTAAEEELHRLRIEGKKLRYLLEFFSSLYPKGELELLLEPLKKLQDHLGTLNDLAIQQTRLLRHVQEQQGRRSQPEMTAAIGALVAVLHQQQVQLSGTTAHIINAFLTSDNKKRFRKLFRVR